MSYRLKEIFYTLQGEGANAGRPAVFCRFTDCNLWSGHERDRAEAICQFCDTDFIGTDGEGGGEFEDARQLADAIESHWPGEQDEQNRFVVCTGGEPLMQLDPALIAALHEKGFKIAAETNGTLEAHAEIDWLTVSPKTGSKLRQVHGDELKLVYPQESGDPESFEDLEFKHFFLQPMDGPQLAENTRLALDYCLAHPRWRLSLQLHKILNIR